MKNKTSILCIMPKYTFGKRERGLSPEYKAIYYTLKNNNYNVEYYDSLKFKDNISKINSNLIKKLKTKKFDILFFSLSHYEILIDTLIYIKKKYNTKLINWFSDDSWKFNHYSKHYSKYFDLVISNSQIAKDYYDQNFIPSILLNWGCPNNWFNYYLPSKKCEIDVLFIGSSYLGRKKIINFLKKNNINIKCYGWGWNTKVLSDNEIGKKFRNAKISLNFSKSKGSIRQTKARVFEITGSGGFCLTETSPEIKNFFKIGKEVDCFEDRDQLLRKIKHYLSKSYLRDKIAQKGNARCKKNYMYSKIIFKIINETENLKNSRNFKYFVEQDKSAFDKLFFIFLKFYKIFSLSLLRPFFSNERALKISRKLVFEIEWRLRGEKTYSSRGWCLNLFGII